MRGLLLPLLATLAPLATLAAPAATSATPAASVATSATHAKATGDPFLWLEDVHGARALAWVRAENAKTLGVLEHDPRYPQFFDAALAIAQAPDRLPIPALLGGGVYNFWQDAEHVHGIWRTTSLADYVTPDPRWKTVIDLDALSASEHANWFWSRVDCLAPAELRCLIGLSDGGEDAISLREFDLASASFVPQGFALPTSKQSAAWVDADELLVARDFGPGTLTASGYPFVVKRLHRGAGLTEAVEVFRGAPGDVEIDVAALEDGAGQRAVLITRGVSFFETETYLVAESGHGAALRLALPLKSQVDDLVAGRLLVTINEDWTANGVELPRGSLVAIDLKESIADPAHLRPRLVYHPGPRESLGEVAATHSGLLVTSYEDVQGRAAVYTPLGDGGWSRRALPLPDLSSIGIVTTSARTDTAILSVTGFLTPSSLWEVDTNGGDATRIKELPPKFEAAGLVVDQNWAVSKDGTRVPYFVVHRQDMPLNGRNPTLLTAYGGFQISETPRYSATVGKLWLERGGVYVVANIRGGGEFGPDWHEAGLKTHRQRIYDDFAAVARDLVGRGITSPRHLGIEGGSNGGLLMGVEFTQHPALWNAVSIEVPLLDMMRYEQIAAGASWVGEYGSVSNPAERAFLASISPYQHLRRGVHYPVPLIWTTTKDDRVGPQHARKFAARLAAQGHRYYYYEVTEGGHGAGANLRERAETSALEMTYFTRQLMSTPSPGLTRARPHR
jgi:prolyl oligopeptidase